MPITTPKGEPAISPPGASTEGPVAEQPGTTEPSPITDEQFHAMMGSGTAAAESAPQLMPPEVAGARGAGARTLAQAAGAITGTWRSGVTVSAMWSINEPRNAWMHVAGLGWRKIFNGRDGAFTALVALAGQARQTGRQIAFREEADGMVYEIYLW
jgi:hypothetical protein